MGKSKFWEVAEVGYGPKPERYGKRGRQGPIERERSRSSEAVAN